MSCCERPVDEARPSLVPHDFFDTDNPIPSNRWVKLEQDVSRILQNQFELTECATRMDRALSLLVKCLPDRQEGLTDLNRRDISMYEEYTQTKLGSAPAKTQRNGESSLDAAGIQVTRKNVPQMLQRGGLDPSMSSEPEKQILDASVSAFSNIMSQEMLKMKMEMKSWFEKGKGLSAHASAEHAKLHRGNTKSRSEIDFGEADTSTWSHMEVDGISAVRDNRIKKVIKLLDEGLDPNTEFQDVRFGRQVLKQCNLLAAAIHAGKPSMVELLVDKRANVDATYGFTVGSSNIKCSGPVSFIAVTTGDLETLGLLLKLRADPCAVSSLNANMIWQAAYSGHAHVLEYLLKLNVDIEKKACSPDRQSVTYTPLHIAIIKGNNICVKTLLNAKATMNYKNQEGISPLEDAIRNYRPGMVNSLISAGAELVLNEDEEENRESQRSDASASDRTNTSFAANACASKGWYAKYSGNVFAKYSSEMLQTLFDSLNPILVRAAAVGLQEQPHQVALMSLEDVAGFFEVLGAPKIEILRALFRARNIQYRGPNQEVLNLNTAAFGDGHVFPHVVLSEHSFIRMEAMFLAGEEFDPRVQAFLDKLVPQEVPPMCMLTPSKVVVLVQIYECLVPGLQNDLRIMRALSACDRFDKIWEELHCQAIFKFGWLQSQWMAHFETVVHAMLMVVFGMLALLSMEKNDHVVIFGLSHRSSIQFAAVLGVPFFLCEVGKELFELLAYISEGWLVEYTTDLANQVDIARIIVDGLLLLQFCVGDEKANDTYELRVWFAGCCFVKWTKTVFTLSSFRRFGFEILPILFTIRNIGPFVVIMLFYLAGIAHAFCATDFLKEEASVTGLNAFYFGMFADESRIKPVYYVNDEGVELSDQQWVTSALVLLLGFALPITLMNIFIAALSESYQRGATSKENLFQHRLAQSVLSHTAIHRTLSRMNCKQRQRRSSNDQLRLWYCGGKEPGDA